MSTSDGIQRPASRLRSTARAALATLGVLIAVGVGALMITSMSTRRAMRPPSFTAPCAETCSGLGDRPQRRTGRTPLPGRALTAPVYRRDSQPKSVWRATGAPMPINANREMIAFALPAPAVAATIRRQRLLLAAWGFDGRVATRGTGRD
jgi:hypothetical protein